MEYNERDPNDISCEGNRKYHIERSPPSETELRGQFERLLSESTIDGSVQDLEVIIECSSENKRIDTTTPTSALTTYAFDNEEIVLALLWQSGYLGAAYYNIATSELYVMEDILDVKINFDITKTLYRQCQPGHVVTTTAMSDKFLEVVKKLIVNDTENSEEDHTSTDNHLFSSKFNLMSKKENDFEICNKRVYNLKLGDEPENASAEERVNFLNSVLNFKCRLMIHALGLLLMYLDKNWNSLVLEATGQPRFLLIHHITLQDIVMIDDETYNALQVVHRRCHPSLFKFGKTASTQEGQSLFFILNRCCSRPGAKHLWNMMRHPTRNVDKINARLDVIQFFVDPKNDDIVQNLKLCLKHVNLLTTMVQSRLSAPQAKAFEWRKLHKTICNVIYIADICTTCKDKAPLFAQICDSVTDEMHNLRYFIEYVVDFDSCKQENKFVVRPGVDPELDRFNHEMVTLPETLTLMGQRDLDSLPLSVKACNMFYLPNIGYVLAINKWRETPLDDTELPTLEFKFVANGTRYYKSPGAIELDNTVGDLFAKITNRQSQLMMRMVQYIRKHIKPVLNVIRHCADLDALISLSLVAQDNNYVRPVMVESQILAIKQGRHPIQELCTIFVPNDTYSGQEKSLVKILTGPNASGKSVYLKQIALIVFMAHIGSFVPAESATIGIVTHILTRMHFEDKIVLHASSFVNDIRQITHALYASTPNSLIMIDEFGKGTSYIDGLALLGACLGHLISRGIHCPHVFVSTHYHKIIDCIPQSPVVERQTFDFVMNEDRSVVFLYRIISGGSDCSFAHSVAASCGMDKKIVERALEIFGCIRQDKLPPPVQNCHVTQRAKAAVQIVEYLASAGDDFDLDELKCRIEQVMPHIPTSNGDQPKEPNTS